MYQSASGPELGRSNLPLRTVLLLSRRDEIESTSGDIASTRRSVECLAHALVPPIVPTPSTRAPLAFRAALLEPRAVPLESPAVSLEPHVVPLELHTVPLRPHAVPIRPHAVPIRPHAVPPRPHAVPATPKKVAAIPTRGPAEFHDANMPLQRVSLAPINFSTPLQPASLASQPGTPAPTKLNVASTSPTPTTRSVNETSHSSHVTPTRLCTASKLFSTASTPFTRSFHSRAIVRGPCTITSKTRIAAFLGATTANDLSPAASTGPNQGSTRSKPTPSRTPSWPRPVSLTSIGLAV